MLLNLFPEAKFIHIHRNPYTVFQSMVYAWPRVRAWWALQTCDTDADRIIQDYVNVYEAFFAQRHLIPCQNFCEVSFEDLEQDPVAQIGYIYERLNLPPFNHVKPALEAYVARIAGYSKNSLPAISEVTRQRLARDWVRCFEQWGYPT